MDPGSRDPIGTGQADRKDDAASGERGRANQKQTKPGIGGGRKNLAHRWIETFQKALFSNDS